MGDQHGPRGGPQPGSRRKRNPPAVVGQNQEGDGYSTGSAYGPRPRPRRSQDLRNLRKPSPRLSPR